MSAQLADKPPLDIWPSVKLLASSVYRCGLMLARRRIHLPREHVGRRIRFANGTRSVVYRETVVNRGPTRDPAVLVVGFKLVLLRGRAHRVFRWASILNTPLFVGFPGYVSKLWMAHDEHGFYRGIYEWDGPGRAERYARALWRVLALGSVRGSIHYRVVPGMHRDEFLRNPPGSSNGAVDWWRPAEPVLAVA
jgi:hypothetical protein